MVFHTKTFLRFCLPTRGWDSRTVQVARIVEDWVYFQQFPVLGHVFGDLKKSDSSFFSKTLLKSFYFFQKILKISMQNKSLCWSGENILRDMNQSKLLCFFPNCSFLLCLSGHLKLPFYQAWKERLVKQSKSALKTVIRETVLEVIDLKRGPGTGRITCVGGSIQKIDVLQTSLNPLFVNLVGVDPKIRVENDAWVKKLIEQ